MSTRSAATIPMPRTKWDCRSMPSSAYLKRESERLALLELVLACLEKGLASGKLKCQLLEQPLKNGRPDAAQGPSEVAVELRPPRSPRKRSILTTSRMRSMLRGRHRSPRHRRSVDVASPCVHAGSKKLFVVSCCVLFGRSPSR